MQAAPISNVPGTATAQPQASTAQATTDAFGLNFESLLKIVLTQLTYQDPLKPMDNFQFVSQLAQFSQIQQGQTANERLEAMVAAQANLQAAGLLGRIVDIPAGNTVISGKVSGVAFDNGNPRVTIRTADGQTISNISIASISQIREAQ
jgi:flagellar basal-body rod modification protein FlgD